jgi:hypothetical protein
LDLSTTACGLGQSGAGVECGKRVYSAGLFSPVRISEGVEVAQPIALLFGLLFFRKYPAARRTNEERAAGLQEWKTHGDYLD